mmetsp:Transcript_43186/g.107901  ORF Transcript_43186/g.107901 Transcript_43186/m.107901 type:complete len:215 (-) Transcript_43186:83-727(-)
MAWEVDMTVIPRCKERFRTLGFEGLKVVRDRNHRVICHAVLALSKLSCCLCCAGALPRIPVAQAYACHILGTCFLLLGLTKPVAVRLCMFEFDFRDNAGLFATARRSWFPGPSIPDHVIVGFPPDCFPLPPARRPHLEHNSAVLFPHFLCGGRELVLQRQVRLQHVVVQLVGSSCSRQEEGGDEKHSASGPHGYWMDGIRSSDGVQARDIHREE